MTKERHTNQQKLEIMKTENQYCLKDLQSPKRPYGNIIGKLFEYVEFHEPCSYTELNKYYQYISKGKNILEDWDPVRDRGGSFSHHFQSMRNKSRRNYSGKVEYLVKQNTGGKYLRSIQFVNPYSSIR